MLKREETRSLRQTLFYSLLAIGLLVGLFLGGIPVLVKVAVFFSEVKNTNSPAIQQDTLPPGPPLFNSPPEAIKANPLTINGFAEPGSKIELFLNDSLYKEVLSANDGTFVIDGINLSEGENILYTIAQDKAGNKSQPSSKIHIILDSVPPALDIISPADNAVFYGDKQKKVIISGKTDPEGVELRINGDLQILDKDGSFKTAYSLSEGENLIKIEATDQSGNVTEKELKITFNP